jgi:hypothetical protein
MADHEHRDILGTVPDQVGDGTFFSEHHIVVGSVGIKKSPRTHQRFGIKPRDLPALIFMHKGGKFYRHPKTTRRVVDDGSNTPDEQQQERFHFSWDSIIDFALQVGGHRGAQQPVALHTRKEDDAQEEAEGENIDGSGVSQEAAQAAEDFGTSMFENVKAQDIPKPTNDWDDFLAMVHVMFKECPNSVFIMLGLVLATTTSGVWLTKGSSETEVTATTKHKKKTS